MEPSKWYGKVVLIGGMIVVVAAFLIFTPRHETAKEDLPFYTATSTGAAGNGSPAANPTGGNTVSSGIVYHFVTPPEGDLWKLGAQNIISWNRAGNFSGHLDLIDARTKRTVGVILSQVGTQQTSYTWDTRYLFISRNSPLKTSVMPGTYVITLTYDGNHIPTFTSASFTIIQ